MYITRKESQTIMSNCHSVKQACSFGIMFDECVVHVFVYYITAGSWQCAPIWLTCRTKKCEHIVNSRTVLISLRWPLVESRIQYNLLDLLTFKSPQAPSYLSELLKPYTSLAEIYDHQTDTFYRSPKSQICNC